MGSCAVTVENDNRLAYRSEKQRKWWREGNKISFEIFSCIKVIQKIAVKNASVALKINYSGL